MQSLAPYRHENHGDHRGHPELMQMLHQSNPNGVRWLLTQRRKGWFQECFGCQAKTEFNYYDANKNRVATSIAESECCERTCCPQCYAFNTDIKSSISQQTLLTVKHPFVCGPGSCKCCKSWRANVQIFSGGEHIGDVTEEWYYCVPKFAVNDAKNGPVFKLHEPTCCAGWCVNCCAAGCCNCKRPFHVFPYSQEKTDGDVMPAGVIMKDEISFKDFILSDAQKFGVTFPETSTPQQRALLIGAAILVNFSFFEGQDDHNDV